MKLSLVGLLAIQHLNTPYLWGGNNYLGYDCSGFILKILHDYGYTLPRLWSQAIYDWHIKRVNMTSKISKDCILYFGSDTSNITHIALALDHDWMIEAGGAGKDSLEMSEQELAKRDARVRILRIDKRKDLVACLPFPYKE